VRSNKIRENIDPKPFVRATEPGTYCLMGWTGPCPEIPSKLWITAHYCDVKVDHKDRHQCQCGVSRMRQPDDPEWENE
jgi:hypothetical protein